jgi:hypothetical protein
VRPGALDYIEVSTRQVLDTVTLDEGSLKFTTGVSGAMFATRRARFGWTATEAYDQLSGWSNGYAALRPR